MTHAADVHSWGQAVQSGTDGVQHIPTDGLISADMLSQALQGIKFSTPTMNIARYAFSSADILKFMGRSPGSSDSYATVRSNVMAVHKAGIPDSSGH